MLRKSTVIFCCALVCSAFADRSCARSPGDIDLLVEFNSSPKHDRLSWIASSPDVERGENVCWHKVIGVIVRKPWRGGPLFGEAGLQMHFGRTDPDWGSQERLDVGRMTDVGIVLGAGYRQEGLIVSARWFGGQRDLDADAMLRTGYYSASASFLSSEFTLHAALDRELSPFVEIVKYQGQTAIEFVSSYRYSNPPQQAWIRGKYEPGTKLRLGLKLAL